ncbi:MAG: hypothetical protein ACI82A_001505 [Candidatus Azotimanducaceae bacterium]|jgi:hypothetical protein
MRYFISSTLSFALLGVLLSVSAPATASSEDELNQLLDGFHDAASRADFTDYFSRFAQESVFLGTDATERWTLEEFKAYTKPHFAGGRGWSYKSVERFWRISGNVAWFDEQLDNDGLGRCRGSGVAVLENGEWKVAQYNLALLIPNDIVDNVALQTKQAMNQDDS